MITEKICILVPAYNEASAIKKAVSEAKGLGFDVLVIDDGSTDSTAALAEEAGAFVIRHGLNTGKGSAVKDGMRYALSHGYTAIITMDGDGQHNPSEIGNFLKMAEKNNSVFIIGNRMANPRTMPLVRLATNRIMSFLLSLMCRQDIPDTQCGYRFIRRQALGNLELISSRFDMESEILIEAARNGIRIDSVPIKTIYRKEESKISPFIDTLRFVRLLLRQALRKEKR